MAVRFDPERLETSGLPVTVIRDVMQAIYAGHTWLSSGAAQVAFSDSGTLVYVPGGVYPEPEHSMVRVDRNGEAEPFALPPRGYGYPRLSPDGAQLAHTVARGMSGDVWIYDIVRGVRRRMTTEGVSHEAPVWSHDGKWLAFGSSRHGSVMNLYRIAADGSGEPERLTVSDRDQYTSSWSPEGVLAFVQDDENIWVLPSGGKPRPFLKSRFEELYPAFSPDGKWLAYMSNESGREEVYVRPYPGPDPATPISSGGGWAPAWSHDGRELFYRGPPSKMMVVSVTPGQPFVAARSRELFDAPYASMTDTRNYDVDAEGRFVMVTKPVERAERVTQMHIVLNWFEELKQRVPTGQ